MTRIKPFVGQLRNHMNYTNSGWLYSVAIIADGNEVAG